MIKKIRKHINILQHRIQGQSTLAAMKETGNGTLNVIVNCIEKVSADRFSPEDREAFQRVEDYRKSLLDSTEVVDYKVFGSDSTALISDVCRKATSPPVWAKLMYALIREIGAKKVLEIGTNLGVSGSYILEALRHQPDAKLITMEGMPRYMEISGQQFNTIATPERFELVLGMYEVTFPEVTSRNKDFDLLFVDGNHQKNPTLAYHRELLNHSVRPAVFVFDDINWSSGMVEAWEIIKKHPQTAYSVDLYKLGIIVVDPTVTSPGHYNVHLSYF